MRGRAFRIVTAALAVLVCCPALTGLAAADPDRSAGTIEAEYAAPGPWAVTAQAHFGCCDGTGAAYDVWYPTDLGAPGTRHPIITWGDGTDAVPAQYVYLLRHLASWGFVVVATENQQTGSGSDILAATRYLIDRSAGPGSIFHDRLDINAVGAMGHSQGATGVLNAMAAAPDLIKTAVPVELPAQVFCIVGTGCADPARLATDSVFYVNGSADLPISPSDQPPWLPGLQSNRAYYNATPGRVAKVWGTLIGLNHNDIQGQPDCARASFPCTAGVSGYLGYPTAWFVGQLTHRKSALAAFAPGGGEFYAPNPHWTNQIGSLPN